MIDHWQSIQNVHLAASMQSFPTLCVQVEPMEHEIDDGGKNESGHEDQHQPAIEGIAASEELATGSPKFLNWPHPRQDH